MPTRRRLLAPVSWALIAPTARAWAGHSATRSVVTITAEALGELIESGRAPVYELLRGHGYLNLVVLENSGLPRARGGR